ncbi:MAG: ABC transporter substrate-binding protein [Acidobacteria bacterium]|nr:ABC transporter substrate-binding protein [Acidobacteriota bacterium]
MEKAFRIVRVVVLGMMALGLTACEKLLEPKTEIKVPEYKISDCAPGVATDKLRLGIPSAPLTLNPVLARDRVSRFLAGQLTATLYRFNPVTLDFEPHLATRFNREPDGKTFTIHLRPNLTFSDGRTPFTAEDVLATLKYITNTKISSSLTAYLSYYKGRLEFSKIDDYTILCKAPESMIAFEPVLARIPVLCERQIREAENAPESLLSLQTVKPDTFLGLGPFVLKQLEAEKIVLGRNPHYWVQDVVGRKLPYTEELQFTVTPNSAEMESALETESIDIVDNMDPVKWAQLKKVGEFAMFPSSEAEATPSCLQYLLWFNQSVKESGDSEERMIHSSWLKQPAFRTAFFIALNRAESLGEAKGKVEISNWFLPDCYADYNDPAPRPEPNPAEARRVLTDKTIFRLTGAEGSYKLEDSEGNAVAIKLAVVQGDLTAKTLGTELVKTFKSLGIGATVMELSFAELMQKFATADYDVVLLPVDTIAHPYFLREVFSSMSYGRPYAPEANAQPDPVQKALNDALDRLYQSPGYDVRCAAARDAQALALKGGFAVSLVRPRTFFGAQKTLQNLRSGPAVTTLLWNLEEIFKKK